MQKKKIMNIMIVILVLVLFMGGFFVYRYIQKKNNKTDLNTIEVLESIKDYGYVLEDRDTEIYKETFLKLKELLNQENIDDQKYAEYVASLFLIDLYTIENKISKYDVGSIDFIYPEEKEKFQNKVMDTMYKLVEDNTTHTRKQELPIVSNVELTSIQKTEYKKEDILLEGYLINADITYKKDLGYDTHVILTLVKEENKIYVVNLTNTN